MRAAARLLLKSRMNRQLKVTTSHISEEVKIQVKRNKAVKLSFRRWKQLTDYSDDVTEALENGNTFYLHLGGFFYIHATNDSLVWISKRVWAADEEDEIIGPSQEGAKEEICLSKEEWLAFLKLMQNENKELGSVLDKIVPCYMQQDHQNQEGMLCCPECNPTTWKLWI